MIIPTLLPVRTNRGLARRSNGLSSIFDDFFGEIEPWKEMESRMAAFSPKVNVTEDAQKITVTAELPGMKQEDIDVTLKGDFISIRGHKKEEKEQCEGKECRYTERVYGEFERVIPLHVEVNSDKVDASMKDGVLTLVLPKVIEEGKKERKISIR